jgi:two-component system response regulator TctD
LLAPFVQLLQCLKSCVFFVHLPNMGAFNRNSRLHWAESIAKPFEIAELEARIRVLLRRSSGHASAELACGALQYNATTREFALAGADLPLTPRERAVLELLIRKVGSTVSKRALAQSLFSFDDNCSTDAIEIYVHRLRKKLEHSNAKILTLRGLGYLLRMDPHG